jgi:hypothetical protein
MLTGNRPRPRGIPVVGAPAPEKILDDFRVLARESLQLDKSFHNSVIVSHSRCLRSAGASPDPGAVASVRILADPGAVASVRILADPDGNEFCVLRPPPGYWDGPPA